MTDEDQAAMRALRPLGWQLLLGALAMAILGVGVLAHIATMGWVALLAGAFLVFLGGFSLGILALAVYALAS